MSNAATLPDKSKSVTVYMADRYGMEPAAFEATLRATVIKPDKNGRVPSREEFAAFLIVAKQYNLNPITKEIFAFTDRGGVVPIVSVDGWSKLINSHPQFDGVTFNDHMDDKGNVVAITCNMHRKDRTHPTCVTEYMAECKRDTDTWRRWPRRMLRHKAMIQAARYAFGFAGIYDEDEGERIVEARTRRDQQTPPVPPVPPIVTQIAKEPLAPPTPPEMTIIDAYRTAISRVTDGDGMDAVWNEIVQPNLETGMEQETYEAIKAAEGAKLSELEERQT